MNNDSMGKNHNGITPEFILKYQYESILKPLVEDNNDSFISKKEYSVIDFDNYFPNYNFFGNLGKSRQFNLSMRIEFVSEYEKAKKLSHSRIWDLILLNAQNQLTIWLCKNAREKYRDWNEIVDYYKQRYLAPFAQVIENTFPSNEEKDIRDSLRWILLGAMMENHFLGLSHKCHFFMELFEILTNGNLPCGWEGDLGAGKVFVH